jgi:UDP-3-O-[3-hydroxymyristoyl] glucosamine N-acyltransferase
LARSLGELAAQFGCELVGDPDVMVSGVGTLSNAGPDSISFFANRAYRGELRTTSAAAVLLKPGDVDNCPVACLICENPYLTYALMTGELYPARKVVAGSHPAAFIHADAQVSATAEVSANATIEEHAIIGDGAYIGPGAVVGPHCSVGAYSRVLANATLVADVVIGERCIIHSGAVIGADGFGNAISTDGWVKVPQIGGVRIGNDVEVGACTTVDRGALDDTVLEDGVRLDNQIQIGHNVRIGAHTAMAACAAISGSTVIGKRCMLGGQVGIAGHVNICDDVVIAGATMISKSIIEPGYYMGSFPGEKGSNWKRNVARFRHLDELVKRVSELEKMAGEDSD